MTGPTGSGKSTTLYATLNILNEPSRNVITIEDPVEYRLAGINQIQVNPRAGLTFATALRSILRADPDVVLVGEIRDRETAVIGIEAALTGHLVLSTLHTNSAASTPMRLVEMGVEPFLVTSALDCVLAQRLARRLCDRCKEGYQPTESELVEAGWRVEDLGTQRVADPVPSHRVLVVRPDRIPGPVRDPRGDAHHRGHRAVDHRAPLHRRPPEDRRDAGDADDARRRPPQGGHGPDQSRRGLPSRRLTLPAACFGFSRSPPCRYTRRRHGGCTVLGSQQRVLGEFLVDRHVLSRDDLQVAIAEARRTGDPLPAVLLRQNLVGEKDITAAIAEALSLRFVDFTDSPLNPDAATTGPGRRRA